MNETALTDLPIEVERYEFFEDPAFAQELDRRDFFRLVGGGLVVALFLRACRRWPSVAASVRLNPKKSVPGCTWARTAPSPSTPAR